MDIDRPPASHSGQPAALIAADVGGTHARIALIGPALNGHDGFSIPQYHKYACADFPSLAAIIGEFRDRVARVPVDRVALAIAGYVVDDAVVNVNLPWAVSISGLRSSQLQAQSLASVLAQSADATKAVQPPAQSGNGGDTGGGAQSGSNAGQPSGSARGSLVNILV